MRSRRRSRLAAILLLGATTTMAVVALAQPAAAELKSGQCEGSATFSTGLVVDQNTPESTVNVVPRSDTVSYTGSAYRAPADADVEIGFSGAVAAKIGPFWVTIVPWSGNAKPGEDAKTGTYTYDIPEIIPGTGAIKVRATHKHGSAPECVGVWTMKIEGGPGWVGAVSGLITALFGALLLTSGITKKVT
jgi:hypothetical protein